ncbi:MAG: group III truncated hemoglobin [Acidithiobacillus sp.]|uniref:group III truncated hemoglobin n=1 Tax=Acidithiobacillus sp. TaxID=1872118 RepID=UPI003D03CD1C
MEVAPKRRLEPLCVKIPLPLIRAVVDDFYERIQDHPTLAQPFAIVGDWDLHKERLTHYWWTVMGGLPYGDYRYALGDKHAPVGVTSPLVDDWLALFHATMLDHLDPDLAQRWLGLASGIGESLRLMFAPR